MYVILNKAKSIGREGGEEGERRDLEYYMYMGIQSTPVLSVYVYIMNKVLTRFDRLVYVYYTKRH